MNYNQPYYGPPAVNGTPQPGVLLEMAYSYVYDVTLTANQVLTNQAVPVDTDADFEIRAIALSLGSGFTWRLADSNTQYRFSGMVDSAIFQAMGNSNVMPMVPPILIPAGGRIGIDITESAGSGATVQIVFMGVKRYNVPATTR